MFTGGGINNKQQRIQRAAISALKQGKGAKTSKSKDTKKLAKLKEKRKNSATKRNSHERVLREALDVLGDFNLSDEAQVFADEHNSILKNDYGSIGRNASRLKDNANSLARTLVDTTQAGFIERHGSANPRMDALFSSIGKEQLLEQLLDSKTVVQNDDNLELNPNPSGKQRRALQDNLQKLGLSEQDITDVFDTLDAIEKEQESIDMLMQLGDDRPTNQVSLKADDVMHRRFNNFLTKLQGFDEQIANATAAIDAEEFQAVGNLHNSDGLQEYQDAQFTVNGETAKGSIVNIDGSVVTVATRKRVGTELVVTKHRLQIDNGQLFKLHEDGGLEPIQDFKTKERTKATRADFKKAKSPEEEAKRIIEKAKRSKIDKQAEREAKVMLHGSVFERNIKSKAKQSKKSTRTLKDKFSTFVSSVATGFRNIVTESVVSLRQTDRLGNFCRENANLNATNHTKKGIAVVGLLSMAASPTAAPLAAVGAAGALAISGAVSVTADTLNKTGALMSNIAKNHENIAEADALNAVLISSHLRASEGNEQAQASPTLDNPQVQGQEKDFMAQLDKRLGKGLESSAKSQDVLSKEEEIKALLFKKDGALSKLRNERDQKIKDYGLPASHKASKQIAARYDRKIKTLKKQARTMISKQRKTLATLKKQHDIFKMAKRSDRNKAAKRAFKAQYISVSTAFKYKALKAAHIAAEAQLNTESAQALKTLKQDRQTSSMNTKDYAQKRAAIQAKHNKATQALQKDFNKQVDQLDKTLKQHVAEHRTGLIESNQDKQLRQEALLTAHNNKSNTEQFNDIKALYDGYLALPDNKQLSIEEYSNFCALINNMLDTVSGEDTTQAIQSLRDSMQANASAIDKAYTQKSIMSKLDTRMSPTRRNAFDRSLKLKNKELVVAKEKFEEKLDNYLTNYYNTDNPNIAQTLNDSSLFFQSYIALPTERPLSGAELKEVCKVITKVLRHTQQLAQKQLDTAKRDSKADDAHINNLEKQLKFVNNYNDIFMKKMIDCANTIAANSKSGIISDSLKVVKHFATAIPRIAIKTSAFVVGQSLDQLEQLHLMDHADELVDLQVELGSSAVADVGDGTAFESVATSDQTLDDVALESDDTLEKTVEKTADKANSKELNKKFGPGAQEKQHSQLIRRVSSDSHGSSWEALQEEDSAFILGASLIPNTDVRALKDDKASRHSLGDELSVKNIDRDNVLLFNQLRLTTLRDALFNKPNRLGQLSH